MADDKMFEKTKAETDLKSVGDVKLVPEEYYEQVLKLARESFTKDEPTCRSVGLSWSKDLQSLWIPVLKQNISLMLVNRDDGNLMGFGAFRFERKDDEDDGPQNPTDEPFKKILRFLKYCEENAKVYEHFGVDEICYFFAINIDAKYRQKQLGLKLMSFTVSFLRNLGVNPLVIKTEGTSLYSQKIFQKLGFETILEVPYEEYFVDGQVVMNNTGEHKSAKVLGKLFTRLMIPLMQSD